jgi:hypothetical protein
MCSALRLHIYCTSYAYVHNFQFKDMGVQGLHIICTSLMCSIPFGVAHQRCASEAEGAAHQRCASAIASRKGKGY